MISLDDQIKKDKQQSRRNNNNDRHRDHSYRQRSREFGHHRQRSRDRYNNRRYNNSREERGRYDSGKRNYHERQEKTIIKFTQLHYSVTKEQLKSLCEQYGELKFCKIHWDKMGRSKETAIVGYYNEKDAENAVQGLKGTKFQDMEVMMELCASERNNRGHGNEEQQGSWSRQNYRHQRRYRGESDE